MERAWAGVKEEKKEKTPSCGQKCACGVHNFHMKMRSTYVGVEYLTKIWRECKQYKEIHFQMKPKFL